MRGVRPPAIRHGWPLPPPASGTQGWIEGDRRPPTGLPVEQSALGDFHREHLFQRHGLGAKLHLVGPVRLGSAALVLNGKGPPNAIRRAMHSTTSAMPVTPNRSERRALLSRCGRPRAPRTRPGELAHARRGPRRSRHLGPCLLDMDERTLARARTDSAGGPERAIRSASDTIGLVL